MDFSTCRVISALSHLIGSQRGFFVPGEPRTGDTRRNPRDDRKEKLRTEYLKVQFRHFLIELFRQQEDIDLVSLSFLPISQKIKLRQFETVLLRRTPTQTASRHSASPTQDCSKLGTTMGWKWISRICERQQQVGPDQNVHNLPSRRLEHWRHHQRNFAITQADTQRQVPCHVKST